MDNCLLVI